MPDRILALKHEGEVVDGQRGRRHDVTTHRALEVVE
jgi:hypothetical protein